MKLAFTYKLTLICYCMSTKLNTKPPMYVISNTLLLQQLKQLETMIVSYFPQDTQYSTSRH